MKKEIENKNKLIKDQELLIQELKNHLQEISELNQTKLQQKESEIKVLQKDVDFTTK